MKGAMIGVLLSFCLILASFAGSLLYTGLNIQSNDHRWCQTLTLLTSHEPPAAGKPGTNPSRAYATKFYQSLQQLERDYGC